jgi:hypothetical protein
MGAFRRGTIIGFGLGYYFGSKAGRERHEQIRRVMNRIQGSTAYQRMAGKATAAVGLGIERGKLAVIDQLGRAARERVKGERTSGSSPNT